MMSYGEHERHHINNNIVTSKSVEDFKRGHIIIDNNNGDTKPSNNADNCGDESLIDRFLNNSDAIKSPNRVLSDALNDHVNLTRHNHLKSSQSLYSYPGYTNYDLQPKQQHPQQQQPYLSLSDSLASLYLPNFAQQISSTIMSGLNWINQIQATTLFQNFWTSGFLRRRFSSSHSSSRTNHVDQIRQEISNQDPSLTYSQYKFAKILNGTIRLQTLKPSELIELSSFGLVELDKDVEPGIGHDFQRYENEKPTWCDSCGEFLFPPVMNDNVNNGPNGSSILHVNGDRINHEHINGSNQTEKQITWTKKQQRMFVAKTTAAGTQTAATTTPASVQADHLIRTYFQCSKCKYVCHWKCLNLIRIDCRLQDTNASTNTTPEVVSPNDDSSDASSSLQQTATEIDSNNNHHQNSDHSGRKDSDDMGEDSNEISVISDISLEEEQPAPINVTGQSDVNDIKEEIAETKASPESYLITPRVILDLRAKILKYNERVRSKGSGLGITLIDEEKGLFRGFLRVHMNLTRPINVIAGKRPPSIYDIINEEEANNQRRTLTSFYMPRDTVKNIHITSDSTSLQVIKAMLKKFKVVDNPQKFALYLRRRFPEEELVKTSDGGEMIDDGQATTRISDDDRNELTISKFLKTAGHDHSLKRLHDHERPLILQLEFDSFTYGSVDIVLQENDNADIAWDAFEVPELRNFLKILEREEGEHLEHVKAHYREMRRLLQALIEYEEKKQSPDSSKEHDPRPQHPGSSLLTAVTG